MATYKEDIVSVELSNGNIHRSYLNHSIGGDDNMANRFGVRLFRNGVPERLSGVNCNGYFRNSKEETIALTSHGTVSGNVAYVTLPASCYKTEGKFTLAIKLEGGGRNVTVRMVDGVVSRTSESEGVTPTTDGPEYYEDLQTTTYTTTGTYKNAGVLFDDLTLTAGHYYRFELVNDYSGSNNGYLYFMNGSTQVKAVTIASDRRSFTYEYIPTSTVTVDVIAGWDSTGVNGTAKYYEEIVPFELILNSLILEGEAWS